VLGHHTCKKNQTKLEITGFENNARRKHFNSTRVEEQQQQMKTFKKRDEAGMAQWCEHLPPTNLFIYLFGKYKSQCNALF